MLEKLIQLAIRQRWIILLAALAIGALLRLVVAADTGGGGLQGLALISRNGVKSGF